MAAGGLAALALAGCASSGAETSGLAESAGSASLAANAAKGPIPAGKARVTITRPSSIVYAAAPATITLNGTKVADVGTGSSATIDVPAGQCTISVSAWSYPGSSTLKINAKPGETLALEVAPRDASLGAGMLLGPLGGLVDGSTAQSGGAFDLREKGRGS